MRNLTLAIFLLSIGGASAAPMCFAVQDGRDMPGIDFHRDCLGPRDKLPGLEAPGCGPQRVVCVEILADGSVKRMFSTMKPADQLMTLPAADKQSSPF